MALLVLLAVFAAWAGLSWFPSAKEAGYRSVVVWGESGSDAGNLDGPIGIALAGEEVFVSDSGNQRIEVFDRNGKFLRAFGGEGDGPGELDRPMHIDARDGKLYVAEYLNDRIQVFSLAGEPLSVIGGPGSGPGEFDAPGGLAVGAKRRSLRRRLLQTSCPATAS